jgi:hypothetical protein
VGLVTGTAYFAAHPLYAAAAGVATGMISNFLFCRFFVFANAEAVFGSQGRHGHPAQRRPAREPFTTGRLSLAQNL